MPGPANGRRDGRRADGRCAIYEKIDALGEAKTVAGLAKRLQPILYELAYYGVTGETAILEAREDWHNQYAQLLRGEAQPGGGPLPARSAAPDWAPRRGRPHPGSVPASLRTILDGSHASFDE
jgi:hypothetical protein